MQSRYTSLEPGRELIGQQSAAFPPQELELADALAESLEALDRGETDLRALARRNPQIWDEIGPLLDIALALRTPAGRAVAPPAGQEMARVTTLRHAS